MARPAPKRTPARAAKPGKTAVPSGTASAQKKADILIAIGATGSGKSTRIKADMDRAGHARLLVIDTMREYAGIPAFTRIDKLAEAMQAPAWRLRFFPSDDPKIAKVQFDLICQLCMRAGRCALLAEELSNFVRANGGGPGWTAVMTRGRHAELTLYGTSQRPALIDKTSMSQATRLYCGNLEFPEDVAVMAKMLSTATEVVRPEEIQGLGPWDYIEKHRETKVIHRGNLAQGAPR